MHGVAKLRIAAIPPFMAVSVVSDNRFRQDSAERQSSVYQSSQRKPVIGTTTELVSVKHCFSIDLFSARCHALFHACLLRGFNDVRARVFVFIIFVGRADWTALGLARLASLRQHNR